MRCPHCHGEKSAVIETRKHEGHVYRRRRCLECGETYITAESVIRKFPAAMVEKNIARLKKATK